ncbi:MAG: beta-phosphoglucomutase family hydrolase [Acidimicrobiia bacterium]
METPTPPDLFAGDVEAVIFDLDGVITDTASVHATAWKRLFDEYLRERAESRDEEFAEFTEQDYLTYVDGKPRYEGVASFLESRDIELPWGDPDDGPDAETVCGLGNRKNRLFRDTLAADGADVFGASVTLLGRLRDAGIATGCVSSSKNCRFVLESVDLMDAFDEILDGNDAAERGLPGKPQPDTYLDCARRLGVDAARSAMVEDALSGVASGAAGGFRHVIGVDRGAGRTALLEAGATVVVDDLGAFL